MKQLLAMVAEVSLATGWQAVHWDIFTIVDEALHNEWELTRIKTESAQ